MTSNAFSLLFLKPTNYVIAYVNLLEDEVLGGGRLFPTLILNLNEDGLSDKRALGGGGLLYRN